MKSIQLKHYYNKFNKQYFKNELPNLWVHYGKLNRNRLGLTRFNVLCQTCDKCINIRKKYSKEVKDNRLPIEIIINSKLRYGLAGDIQSFITLLHEMVHVSIGGRYRHGPKFKKEIKRLLWAGAFTPWL